MTARFLPLVNLAIASSALGFGAGVLYPRIVSLEQKQEEAYFATAAALAHHAATADVRLAQLQLQLEALLASQTVPVLDREASAAAPPSVELPSPQQQAPTPAAAASVTGAPTIAPAVPTVTIIDPHAVQAAFSAEGEPAIEPEDAPAVHVAINAAGEPYPEEILVAERELAVLKAALAAELAKAR